VAYNEALYDGTINDNYNYLIDNEFKKSRFIIKHLPIIKEYAEKCEHITEFGVDAVNSTWALLAGKPKVMVSVDPANTKAPEIHKLALKLAKEEEIDYKFINDYSTEIEEIDETDLLFIDSGHTYECMSQEFKMHSHKVKKYMILHDMNMPELQQAVADVLGVYDGDQFSGLAAEILKEKDVEWEIIYKTRDNEGLWILERVK
jgi:hypothetical protein